MIPDIRVPTLLAALALSTVLSTSSAARADPPPHMPAPHQPPLVFVLDPKLGMEAGIRTSDSLGRLVFRYDEVLPRLSWNETTVLGKAGGVLARSAQLTFVDFTIASLETTIIHEVFGHGARALDLGQTPKYGFALPGVYCAIAGGSCTSHAEVAATGNRDRDLLFALGGLEANYLTGYWINLRTVQAGGWVHQGDLIVYANSKLSYGSLQSSNFGRTGAGGDVGVYVTFLQDRFDLPRPEDRNRIASRLRVAALWNLADPMLWYSAYGVFYRGVGQGDRWTRAPLQAVGKTTFYAAPRFGLTPFGAEHYVDLFLGRGSSVVALYGRAGSSGLASYTGAGVRAIGLRVHDRLSLGGEFDMWSQPETLLDDRGVYERPQVRGINAGLSGDLRVIGGIGLVARVAYKTRGYLAGQPTDDGLYGYVGASVMLDSPMGCR